MRHLEKTTTSNPKKCFYLILNFCVNGFTVALQDFSNIDWTKSWFLQTFEAQIAEILKNKKSKVMIVSSEGLLHIMKQLVLFGFLVTVYAFRPYSEH